MSKVVIFDLDGLMFDTESVFAKAWDYAGEKFGIGKAGYMTLRTLGLNQEMRRQVWQEEFGSKYNEDVLNQYKEEFLEKYYSENKVQAKDGLHELLDYLVTNKYKLAIASSSPEWKINKYLIAEGVVDYFDVIVSGEMVEKSKPNPDIYLKACELLAENPCNCIALEDSKNGLLAAYNAGCKPIMIPDLWMPDKEIKKILHAKFDVLSDVIGYLKNM